MNNHSRLYNELQDRIETRAWFRWHKLVGIGAVIGFGLGLIIGLIN